MERELSNIGLDIFRIVSSMNTQPKTDASTLKM
jgi:hypothetical protein